MFFSTVEVSAGNFSHIVTTGLEESTDDMSPVVPFACAAYRDLLDFTGLIDLA